MWSGICRFLLRFRRGEWICVNLLKVSAGKMNILIRISESCEPVFNLENRRCDSHRTRVLVARCRLSWFSTLRSKSCDTRPIYSLWSFTIDNMNADRLRKVLSYGFLKYQFLAKYRTNQPSGLTALSVVGDQTNEIQPSQWRSWAAIEPNDLSILVCGQNNIQPGNQLKGTQAHWSCTGEYSCICHYFLLTQSLVYRL